MYIAWTMDSMHGTAGAEQDWIFNQNWENLIFLNKAAAPWIEDRNMAMV